MGLPRLRGFPRFLCRKTQVFDLMPQDKGVNTCNLWQMANDSWRFQSGSRNAVNLQNALLFCLRNVRIKEKKQPMPNEALEMSTDSEHKPEFRAAASSPSQTLLSGRLFLILRFVALAYALVAGLRTVSDPDLGWQMATGRWIVQHRQVPSTEVLSYTASGQPWTYPVGSELLLYAAYLLGGYGLLSWLGAAACTGTIALSLRRGSWLSAALAILAVPRVALRTAPRAEMFTVLLFAAFLTLLWQQHETGHTPLWLFPVLMAAWVNLHLGFVAGLALIAGYIVVEILEMFWPGERRPTAVERLRRSIPWFVATAAATLINPWGWGIYRALVRQQSAMANHSQTIWEWKPSPLDWMSLSRALSLRDPNGTFVLLLLVAAVAAIIATVRRQPGAAVLLIGVSAVAIRHMRFQALFSITVVILAGAVLTTMLVTLRQKMGDERLCSILANTAVSLCVFLAAVRSAEIVSNRFYMGSTDLISVGASFGTGLNWWFPEGAAQFIERENLPGQLFNSYNEGGYIAWRLGEKYKDYIDGRAIPFGEELSLRNIVLMGTPPESPEWQREAERYDINTIIVPLAYYALGQFPLLRRFCESASWRPVYLDEAGAVFLRRRPETESMIQRLQINCSTTPLPAIPPPRHDSKALHQWANAAAVLNLLGRNSEALAATSEALAIFPESAYVHFTRANVLAAAGDLRGAEQQFLIAAELKPNGGSWTMLAQIYERQGRVNEAIQAWEHVADLSDGSHLALLSLGYDDLDAHRPKDALKAFDRAVASVPARPLIAVDQAFYANLAHGRALAWNALGDVPRAITFAEEVVRLAPNRSEDWLLLAQLYESRGRTADAEQARQRAMAPRN
jgi:tetratricopeptide (TPR) repeat protein